MENKIKTQILHFAFALIVALSISIFVESISDSDISIIFESLVIMICTFIIIKIHLETSAFIIQNKEEIPNETIVTTV